MNLQFDYNCFNDILQIVDRSVNISWFQYPVQAGVSTRLSLQVSVASLAPDISRDISDAFDGTPNIKFLVTSSSDFAGTEDVLRITVSLSLSLYCRKRNFPRSHHGEKIG